MPGLWLLSISIHMIPLPARDVGAGPHGHNTGIKQGLAPKSTKTSLATKGGNALCIISHQDTADVSSLAFLSPKEGLKRL